MKKLPKLFVSVFASIILSVTSASAIISIPDVKTLQNEDAMFKLINAISKEYERTENCELSKLRIQIKQICINLLRIYGVKSVASFVVPLAVAFDEKTKKLNLELLKKINWSIFLIVNDFTIGKLRLVLSGEIPITDPPLTEESSVDLPSIKLLPSNLPVFRSSSVNLILLI